MQVDETQELMEMMFGTSTVPTKQDNVDEDIDMDLVSMMGLDSVITATTTYKPTTPVVKPKKRAAESIDTIQSNMYSTKRVAKEGTITSRRSTEKIELIAKPNTDGTPESIDGDLIGKKKAESILKMSSDLLIRYATLYYINDLNDTPGHHICSDDFRSDEGYKKRLLKTLKAEDYRKVDEFIVSMQKAFDPNTFNYELERQSRGGKSFNYTIRTSTGPRQLYSQFMPAKLYKKMTSLYSYIVVYCMFYYDHATINRGEKLSSYTIYGIELLKLKNEHMDKLRELSFQVQVDEDNDRYGLWRRGVLIANSAVEDPVETLIKYNTEYQSFIRSVVESSVSLKIAGTTPMELLSKYVMLSHGIFAENVDYLVELIRLFSMCTKSHPDDPMLYGKYFDPIPTELFDRINTNFPDPRVRKLQGQYTMMKNSLKSLSGYSLAYLDLLNVIPNPDSMRFNVNSLYGKSQVYAGLVVLPSKTMDIAISSFSKPIHEKIVELAPVNDKVPDEIMYSLLYRWETVQKYFEKKPMPSKIADPKSHFEELKTKYATKLKDGVIKLSEIVAAYVLVKAKLEGKNLRTQTDSFATAVTEEYKHLFSKSSKGKRCIPPLEPEYFPHYTSKDDQIYMSYLKQIGFLDLSFKREQIVLDKLREDPSQVPSVMDKKKRFELRYAEIKRKRVDLEFDGVEASEEMAEIKKQLAATVDAMAKCDVVVDYVKVAHFPNLNSCSLDYEKKEFNKELIHTVWDLILDYDQEAVSKIPSENFYLIDEKEVDAYDDYVSHRLRKNQVYLEWEEQEMIRYAKKCSHEN